MNRALVVAEHSQGKLNASTSKCVSCVQGIGEVEIDIAVLAVDAATGHQIWAHDHPYEFQGGGEGPLGQNRGVALLGDRLFVGTWDSKLTALSAARTGPANAATTSSAAKRRLGLENGMDGRF